MCHQPTNNDNLFKSNKFHLNLLQGNNFLRKEGHHIQPQHVCQSHKLEMQTKPPTPWARLSPKHVTLPPRKKFKTTFKSQVFDSKEDEE